MHRDTGRESERASGAISQDGSCPGGLAPERPPPAQISTSAQRTNVTTLAPAANLRVKRAAPSPSLSLSLPSRAPHADRIDFA